MECPHCHSSKTQKDGLYLYDAIARLQDANTRKAGKPGDDAPDDPFENIGSYIRLGALGTALLPSSKPRVLVVDEIDKSDIDLPNDLLTVFEEGSFEIPELVRIEDSKPKVTVRTAYKDKTAHTFKRNGVRRGKTTIVGGTVTSNEFPLLVLRDPTIQTRKQLIDRLWKHLSSSEDTTAK